MPQPEMSAITKGLTHSLWSGHAEQRGGDAIPPLQLRGITDRGGSLCSGRNRPRAGVPGDYSAGRRDVRAEAGDSFPPP